MGHESGCIQPEKDTCPAQLASHGPGPGLAANCSNNSGENGTRRVTLQVSMRPAKRQDITPVADGHEVRSPVWHWSWYELLTSMILPNKKELLSTCCCPQDLPEYSLYILKKSHPIRKAALWVITSKYFDWFILLTILANCVELALYSHRPGFDQTSLAQLLNNAEYCFLVIFGTEMVLKIIALGFVLEQGSYLRNGESVDTAKACGGPPDTW